VEGCAVRFAQMSIVTFVHVMSWSTLRDMGRFDTALRR
jgi:hypothetical protein